MWVHGKGGADGSENDVEFKDIMAISDDQITEWTRERITLKGKI
jgi:hypothetical protein